MRELGRPRTRVLHLAAAALLAVVAVVAVQPGADRAAAEGDLGAGGEYHPITPEVLFSADSQAVSADVRVDVDALPLVGVPDDPAQVLALLLDVSVWKSDVDGELVAFSGGIETIPTSSSLTYSRGRPTSALVLVRPSSEGVVSFNLTPRGTPSGRATVRATVVGWFSTSAAPERGSRIITRPMRGVFNGRLGVAGSSSVGITGRAGVPDSSAAEAVIVNVTARNATANTAVSLGPDPTAASERVAPSLMVKRREATTAMLAVVPLGADGTITIHNRAGDVDVALHVVGYTRLRVDPSTVVGRVVPLTRPFRAIDTTSPPEQSRPLGPGQAEPWGLAAFVNDLTYAGSGEKVGPVSGVLGAMAAHSHRRQYPLNPVSTTQLRVYPDGRPLPKGPNLTVSEEQRRSNTVLSELSSSDVVQVYNKEGTTHYRIDLSAVILG